MLLGKLTEQPQQLAKLQQEQEMVQILHQKFREHKQNKKSATIEQIFYYKTAAF